MTSGTAEAESETTRTRGSIARRMLVAAAIWSVAGLAAAGWSLAALYEGETEQRLDDELDQTIITLTSAVDTSPSGEVTYNNSPLPNDERFNRTYSGWYWAYIDLNLEAKTFAPLQESQSLFNTRPAIPSKLIATAIEPARRAGSWRHDWSAGCAAADRRAGGDSPPKKEPDPHLCRFRQDDGEPCGGKVRAATGDRTGRCWRWVW